MERYAVVQQSDSIVRTIVQVVPGQEWHCDDDCDPVLLAGGEDCDMGWLYRAGESPRFMPPLT